MKVSKLFSLDQDIINLLEHIKKNMGYTYSSTISFGIKLAYKYYIEHKIIDIIDIEEKQIENEKPKKLSPYQEFLAEEERLKKESKENYEN